jgi:uncharacterized protein
MKKINNLGWILKLLIVIMIVISITGCSLGRNIITDREDKNPGGIFVNDLSNKIPKIDFDYDHNGNGISDLDDFLAGAREEAKIKPRYKSAYYQGGYPPENEGVCTDTIWRAFMHGGYNLKDMVDEDIRNNVADYPRVAGKPDPNIDFRRVSNLIPFFEKHAEILTTEIIPGDMENLKQWQGGDIVTFGPHNGHIAIVSDKRNRKGVPYIIHNGGPYTKEEDGLLFWHNNISPITYHFRFPKR